LDAVKIQTSPICWQNLLSYNICSYCLCTCRENRRPIWGKLRWTGKSRWRSANWKGTNELQHWWYVDITVLFWW